DTEQGELLINTRMAYVAVSRARYDAQIYTDNKEELAEYLSREHSHSTAVEASHENHHEHTLAANQDVGSFMGHESDQTQEQDEGVKQEIERSSESHQAQEYQEYEESSATGNYAEQGEALGE